MTLECINIRTLVHNHVKQRYGDANVLVIESNKAASIGPAAEEWAALRDALAGWHFELPRVFDGKDFVLIEGLSPSVAEKIMDCHRKFPMWYYQEGKCTARTAY